jgi:hypothetical protein
MVLWRGRSTHKKYFCLCLFNIKIIKIYLRRGRSTHKKDFCLCLFNIKIIKKKSLCWFSWFQKIKKIETRSIDCTQKRWQPIYWCKSWVSFKRAKVSINNFLTEMKAVFLRGVTWARISKFRILIPEAHTTGTIFSEWVSFHVICINCLFLKLEAFLTYAITSQYCCLILLRALSRIFCLSSLRSGWCLCNEIPYTKLFCLSQYGCFCVLKA